MRIKKICLYCKQTFIAQRTTTKYCSHRCNCRDYKDQERNQKKLITEKETISQIKIAPENLSIVQTKEFLDLKEACILLKCCETTLRKLIYSQKVPAQLLGRKYIIRRKDIDSLFETFN